MKEFEDDVKNAQDIRDIFPDYTIKESVNQDDTEMLLETKENYQKGLMDEAWYAMSVEAYAQMLSDIHSSQDDKLIKGSREEYYKTHPQQFDTKDRKKIKMEDPGNKVRMYVADVSQDAMNQGAEEYFSGADLWKISKNLMQLGMVQAHINHMIGKEYDRWMLRLPESEEHKEEKAKYLALNSVSRACFMDRAFKMYVKTVDDQFTESGPFPVKDTEVLKNLTVRQFIDICMFGKDDRENYVETMKHVDPDFSMESKVFDLMKKEKMSSCPGIVPSDKNILNEMKSDIKRFYMNNTLNLGREFVKSNLGEHDKKLIDIGAAACDMGGGGTPKSIKKWVENDAAKYMKNFMISGYNEAYDELRNGFQERKAYEINKEEPIISSLAKYDKKGKKLSGYEAFIAEHMGQNTFGDSPMDKKGHLALVISALAFKSKGVKFNRNAIYDFADKLAERPAFKSLPYRQTTMGLYNVENAIKIHNSIYYNTFGIKEENFEQYIAKMKMLSDNMMPSAGRSTEYRNLCAAVKKVASCRACDNNLLKANAALIDAIEAYTDGKMKVRRSTGGNARFENTLDALAIVNTYVPGSRYVVKRQVESIREARGVDPGHKDYVDIRNYGAENARNKNVARIAAEAERQRGRMVS